MKTTLMYAIVGVSWFALSASSSAEEPAVIADNSFFIEEAYNQEPGVVQHILNVAYFAEPEKEGTLSLTEEVPLGGMRHQGSVTVPFQAIDGEQLTLNEIFFHYRYQIISNARGLAVAPRISLSIGTGEADRAGGNIGYQFNLPVSLQLNSTFVAHINAGANWIPKAETLTDCVNDPGQSCYAELSSSSFSIGASFVWLVTPTVNFLVEVLTSQNSAYDSELDRFYESESIVNPAVRFAINSGSLQVVPGFGVPIRFADGETTTGVFGYLSFEHPY